MRTPVRFYITQADDQPVVRTTTVARPRPAAADETPTQPTSVEPGRDERRARRVTALIRRRSTSAER